MRLVVENQDGSIRIISSAPIEVLEPLIGTLDEHGVKRLSQEDYRKHILKRNNLQEGSFVELSDFEKLPTDFRNAWVLDNRSVVVDMPKAREIQKSVLRAQRKPYLENLDMEYLKADEADDEVKKKQIAQEKQVLRDITKDPRIESATTPEELKAISIDA